MIVRSVHNWEWGEIKRNTNKNFALNNEALWRRQGITRDKDRQIYQLFCEIKLWKVSYKKN